MPTAPGHGSPGWFVRCPTCDYQVDLESLGWIRVGAYSYGKRKLMRCPHCARLRWTRIVHLDAEGRPDQGFWQVLAMVLLYQAAIWAVLLLLLALCMTLFTQLLPGFR